MLRFGWLSLLAPLVLLSGCAGFAKGVTQAILGQDQEDTRACHIEGPVSQGLEASLRAREQAHRSGGTTRRLKVLMVHGIEEHRPGYSGQFTEHLMRALGLQGSISPPRASKSVLPGDEAKLGCSSLQRVATIASATEAGFLCSGAGRSARAIGTSHLVRNCSL